MFDIAWSEYLLIATLALVLLGPKELPFVLRTIGSWVAKIRNLAINFNEQIYNLKDFPLEGKVFSQKFSPKKFTDSPPNQQILLLPKILSLQGWFLSFPLKKDILPLSLGYRNKI